MEGTEQPLLNPEPIGYSHHRPFGPDGGGGGGGGGGGAPPTEMVAEQFADVPALLIAVMVHVWVLEGLTAVEPDEITVPEPIFPEQE